MYAFITVLIILCCLLIIMVVLIQNPKGGGLGATFGGVSNSMMGVQRTTDFLEKSTWTFAIALLALSLFSNFFLPDTTGEVKESELKNNMGTTRPFQEQPAVPTQENEKTEDLGGFQDLPDAE